MSVHKCYDSMKPMLPFILHCQMYNNHQGIRRWWDCPIIIALSLMDSILVKVMLKGELK